MCKSDYTGNVVDKLAKSEKLFFLLLSIISIIPFYSDFQNDRLFYVLKYVFLVLFLGITFFKTRKGVANQKVILFSVLLFFISFLNSFYIVENLGTRSLILSLGFTVMFGLVGIYSMFYFSKIPFNIFKQIIFIFFIGVLVTVNIPNMLLINNPAAFYFFDGRFRFTGTFQNSNVMSRFALLGLFLVLRLWPLCKGRFTRFLFLVTAATSIYLIYLSDSRTSLIASFLAVGLISIVKIYKSVPKRLFLGVTFIAGAVLIWLAYYYFTVALQPISSFNLSELTSGRTDIWSSVFETSTSGLIFGVGSVQQVGIHNGYIEIIKYYGMLGFIAWMTSLLFMLKRKVKFSFKNNSFSNMVGLGVVLIFLFYHMFEGALFSFGNLASIYLWLEIAQVNRGHQLRGR